MSGQQKTLHAAMDRLLQEQGDYRPVELLLQSARLTYRNYEAWRCGEIEHLESALAGSPERVRTTLRQAAAWAGQLGLLAQAGDYSGWGNNAGRPLQFSADGDARIEALYATDYQRPASAPQMDLFLDAGPTVALNQLGDALLARQTQAARQHLLSLLQISPEHALRGQAELLCDALDDLTSTPLAAEPASELEAIEQHLAPAASALLGARARDLLAPFWQRLARTLAGIAFDPARPHLHASWALGQCLDWQGVCDSIAAESRPLPSLLLERLARAEQGRGRRQAALRHWCRLCWQYPEQAAATLSDPTAGVDTGLRAAWHSLEALDADELDSPAWLPAWLLLCEPGLAGALDADTAADPTEPPIRAFGSLRELLLAGRKNTTPAQLEHRRGLQAANPSLFQAFLRSL